MTDPRVNGWTAFPGTEKRLRELIQKIDKHGLKENRVSPCSFPFARCEGVCCSLAVAVTAEESEVLIRLARERGGEFKKMNCDFSGEVIFYDRKLKRRFLAKKRRGFKAVRRIVLNVMAREEKLTFTVILGFLKFLRTCVFASKDGGCGLQRLAEGEGRPPWYYKPVNCWKYPLTISEGCLTVPEALGNPYFPCCGDKAAPASESFKNELDRLAGQNHRPGYFGRGQRKLIPRPLAVIFPLVPNFPV